MALQVWLPLLGDLTNNGIYNSTISNTNATITNSGKLGKCYTTNGSNAYITGTYTATVNMSFCIWVKFNSSFAGHLIDARVGDIGYQPMYVESNRLQTGGSTGGFPSFTYVFSTGVWYHLCVVYTQNNVSLYVNGSLVGTSTGGKGYDYGSKEFTLCCRHSHNQYYIPADIQDFRIYDHALSPKEVEILARGLVLHYPMTGGGKGSTNFIKNSSYTEGTTSWSNWGSPPTREIVEVNGKKYAHIKSNGTQYQGYSQNLGIPLQTSTRYTLTFRAFSPTNNNINIGFHWNNASSIVSQSWYSVALTTEPKLYTVAVTTGGTVDRFNIMIGSSQTSTIEVYWTDVKLELGSIATPWIPYTTDTAYSAMGYNDNIEYDVSGYNYHGTKTNVTYDSDTPRYATSTKVTTTSGVFSHPNITFDKFTIAFWGKHTASNKILMGSCPNISTGNTTWYWYGDNSFKYPSGEFYYEHNAGTYTLNTWMHFVVTYDGSNIKVYRNGIYEGSKAATGNMTLDYLSVGRGIGANYAEAGNVSDFRIYTTALSAEDIQKLYNTSASISNNGTLMGYEFIEN